MQTIEMSNEGDLNLRTVVEAGTAGAVLLGLIFVGLELRQNTAAVQAATFQDLTHASSDFLVEIGSDAEAVRIYSSGRRDPDILSPDKRIRYIFLQQAFWLRMQNAYMQRQRGTLTDEDWSIYRSISCGSANAPGPEAVWRMGIGVSHSFMEFLESCDDES